jgi:8-oxo-dGTP pyrophosphatase MutT (NUDIX family)
MLSPERRMLLMQVQEPSSNFTVWFAPGGGAEPNKSPEMCLRREIEEETGTRITNIGPLIWQRHHTFEWDGQMVSQDEDFYYVPIDEFEPDSQTNPSRSELMAFLQFKWWSPDEIAASHDVFAPRLLAEHLRALIEKGIPKAPVDVGI